MAADLLRDRCRIAAIVPLVVVLSGCEMAIHDLAGRASDVSTHTYPLTPGGVVEIANTNGKIDVEGADVETVEIRTERIAKAATDDGARRLLPSVKVQEDVSPDHIKLETAPVSGLLIGASYEVRYTVRAPKSAVLRLHNTNGEVSVTGTTGQLNAQATNGAVKASGVSGEILAHTTNGAVVVELAALTAKVSLETTNGGVSLTVPDDAKADVSASCTNGGISVTGLKLETTESSRRRIEGKLNGGGTMIDLRTTNGGIRLRSRSSPA